MKTTLRQTKANYVYVTDVPYNPSLPWGGPIWNSVPSYWGNAAQQGSERWCLRSLSDGSGC
jgi:hypothetical protein